MSNTELTKHYLSMQYNTSKMLEVPYFDIINALEKHFNGNWTWELADEKIFMDGTSVSTTITLYTPGRVYTGRSLCKIKDYNNNYLFALLDACQTFMDKNTSSEQKTTISNNTNNNTMSADQIMNAINTPEQKEINTVAQMYNYKDSNGMPTDEVPFDKMTDNCNKELQKEVGIVSDEYNMPQAKLKGFSQRQVDAINKFKQDFQITNDAMFNSWVNTWNPNLTSKKDIIPDNVDEFIEWVEKMGKEGC